jgi:PAS domain S-box-containing protein
MVDLTNEFDLDIALLKRGLDHLDANVIIANEDRVVVYANNSAINFLNYAEDEIRKDFSDFSAGGVIGKKIEDFHKNPLYQKQIIGNLRTILRTNFKVGNLTLCVKAMPITNNAGQRIGFMAEIEDITERENKKLELLKAEDELITEKFERREIEILKQKYFEHHYAFNKAIVFAEKNAEGLFTFVNEHFCRISGYSEDELIGSTPRLLESDVHPPAFYDNLWATIKSGHVWRDEVCNRHKNGSLYWVDTVIVPIIDESENKPRKYISIRFDITDRKKAEQRQEELTKQVNQMQKTESLSRLTSGIAHDFNNILMAISGYNQLNTFTGEYCTDKKLKEEILFNTEQVNIASKRATNLIKKMMAYSRQNTTNKEMEVKPTYEVIDEVLSLVRPALTSIFQLNTDEVDSQLTIQIDSTELHQILTNLIVNARDAMKEGGVITVSLKKVMTPRFVCNSCAQQTLEGEFIELTVADNGTGIDKQVLKNIFDPFFTTKVVGEGTGLGLSTVSGMVHEAEGHIIVKSKTTAPNSGTTFQLLFPIVNPT